MHSSNGYVRVVYVTEQCMFIGQSDANISRLPFLGNQIAANVVFCFVESVRNGFNLNLSEL